MAKDYGNRRSTHQKSRGPHQLLVVAVTFLLGYATATVVDIQTVSHWVNTQVLNSEHSNTATPKATQKAEIPAKPKFEFYTLLANDKVEPKQQSSKASAQNDTKTSTVAKTVTNTPASDSTNQNPATVTVAEGKPLAPSQSNNKGSFLVQVASFKARKDAEQMKGLLTLKGFDVNVVSVTHANGNWYRVVIGPYPNRQSAQQVQVSIAKTEHLNGMVTPARG